MGFGLCGHSSYAAMHRSVQRHGTSAFSDPPQVHRTGRRAFAGCEPPSTRCASRSGLVPSGMLMGIVTAKWCRALRAVSVSQNSRRAPVNVAEAVSSSAVASKATVGLMLSGARIENLVIGGPAFVSGKLDRDDEIMRVDGIECETVEGLHRLLRGSDRPGSSLLLTVKKASTVKARPGSDCLRKSASEHATDAPVFGMRERQGRVENVQLLRMATAHIQDRRQLFELFATLKDGASGMHLLPSSL
jgi:hypothetical protein